MCVCLKILVVFIFRLGRRVHEGTDEESREENFGVGEPERVQVAGGEVAFIWMPKGHEIIPRQSD